MPSSVLSPNPFSATAAYLPLSGCQSLQLLTTNAAPSSQQEPGNGDLQDKTMKELFHEVVEMKQQYKKENQSRIRASVSLHPVNFDPYMQNVYL